MSTKWCDGVAIVQVSAENKKEFAAFGDELNEVADNGRPVFVGTYAECHQFIEDNTTDLNDLRVRPFFDVSGWSS
jgi:hypothetical protein